MTSEQPRDTVALVAGQDDDQVCGAFPDSAWWARGLALHERRTAAAVAPGPSALTGLREWQAAYGSPDRFAVRLANAGLTESALLDLLAESPTSLAARIERPRWVATVERAVRSAPVAGHRPLPSPDWRAGFTLAVRAMVEDARDRVIAAVQPVLTSQWIDLDAVATGFAEALGRDLVDCAARTLVSHLHSERAAGRLRGEDGAERFADYIGQLGTSTGLAALFTEYPVLARLLGEAAGLAVDAHVELLSRFGNDRPSVIDSLLAGVDPGPITAIAAKSGDPHRQGRAVAILTFADGAKVVYRPRDVGSHLRFGELVDWVNKAIPDLDLRTARVLARPTHGWIEHIDAAELADESGADRFYRRQGALLAMLHLTHAADIHFENLIACADQPVLVDAETLFHPRLSEDPGVDPAAGALSDSVYRTSLLPVIVVGETGAVDVSGLGGDRGTATSGTLVDWEFPGTDGMRLIRRAGTFRGGRNRPRLHGRDLAPEDHESALLEGFRQAYDAVLRHRDEFTALLTECAKAENRVIVRPTRGYSTLLAESTHPDLMRDALHRDRVLDVLWVEAGDDPFRLGLAAHEIGDLWSGDVPLFTGIPDSPDLFTSTGQRLPRMLAGTGFGCALAKVAAGSEADRRDQAWIISATLATRRQVSSSPAHVVAGTAADERKLLTAACALGDQLVARGMTGHGRVNWLGLELVDDRQWLVLPMGASLANGYVGVALFLAQLAQCSGVSRYGEVARQALAAVPPLLAAVAANPGLASVIGHGGLQGLGGIAYGLARVAGLLRDGDIRAMARDAVALAETVEAGPMDWATGTAGCLAAMLAVDAELDWEPARRLASVCADRLAESPEHGPGFGDGAAGIATALALSGRDVPVPHLAPTDSPGWYAGDAGRALAAHALGRLTLAEVHAISERPVLRDLSLCHGELGVVEALTAQAANGCRDAAQATRARAGLVLDVLDSHGPVCGTPGGVFTPGLLTGVAGIGYGLLRLATPDRVPSVLLLEPSRGSV